jgi:Inverse autotransporter, beta-domain
MKGTLTVFNSLLAAVLLAAGTAAASDIPAPDSSSWTSSLPSGRINLGVQAGDQQAESFGDVLVPVAASASSLLFLNPRGSWNDDGGREFNLGLGYRRLFPEHHFIAGLNVFYDRRESELDNRFNQFGLGAEFLSVWVDARANAYLPEGGSREMDRYAVTTQTRRDYTEVWAAPTGEDHLITQSGYDATAVYNIKTTQHFQMSPSRTCGT